MKNHINKIYTLIFSMTIMFYGCQEDEYSFGESTLTPEKLAFFKKAAQNTLNDERQKISIRVPRNDLSRLKAKAMREGIPYQTAINSLIHKYVSR